MEYILLNIFTSKFGLVNKVEKGMTYELNPKFGKGINKIDDTTYELHLAFSLHDVGEKISPYDIDIEVVGVFKLTGGTDSDTQEFLNVNAVSILFPYLRCVLSNSMTSMMISPIILPIVDAKELFKENK